MSMQIFKNVFLKMIKLLKKSYSKGKMEVCIARRKKSLVPLRPKVCALDTTT
jgi:hypothetical protein